jgi:hypothetical protein
LRLPQCLSSGLTTQGSVVRGHAQSFPHPQTCKAPHPLQPIVRRPTPSPSAEPDDRTGGGGAAGPRSWCAPAWRAPKPHRSAARAGAAAPHVGSPERAATWRAAVNSRRGRLGQEFLAEKPVRRAECAALKPVPAAPNASRVRGAGPPRKTFIAPKACKAPHPLQPIVRPRSRQSRSVLLGLGERRDPNPRNRRTRRDNS